MIQADEQWRRTNIIDHEEFPAFDFSLWVICLKCRMTVLLGTLRKDAYFFNMYFQIEMGNLNFFKVCKDGNKDNFVSTLNYLSSHI